MISGPAQVGKSHLAGRFCEQEGYWFLNLDPARQGEAPLASVSLLSPGGKPFGFRFVGSQSITGDPIAVCAALIWALDAAGDAPLVCELPIERPSAIHVHLLRNFMSALKPDKLISIGYEEVVGTLQPPAGCEVELRHPAEEVDRMPPTAVTAWRKAAWRSYFETAEEHTLPLSSLLLMGGRHGAGLPLESEELSDLRSIGLASAHYAEVVHSVLHIVSPVEADSGVASSAADHFGCDSVHFAHPSAYIGLVCGLENRLGEHFALARITEMDFAASALKLVAPSEAPLPVARLHFGRLRLDEEGNKLRGLRAWQV